jgi:hypothetical protein
MGGRGVEKGDTCMTKQEPLPGNNSRDPRPKICCSRGHRCCHKQTPMFLPPHAVVLTIQRDHNQGQDSCYLDHRGFNSLGPKTAK